MIAYVVGIGLIILVLIGVPLQVWADNDVVVKIVGPLHGALYVIYLLLTLDLARRIRMNVIVMLAGDARRHDPVPVVRRRAQGDGHGDGPAAPSVAANRPHNGQPILIRRTPVRNGRL